MSTNNFCVMFQDEAGFGRINKPKRCWCGDGIRPVVPCHHIREYVYAYGAVNPLNGEFYSLILPYANTECMNYFLKGLSEQYSDNYILLIVDNASWHKSKALEIPPNIELCHSCLIHPNLTQLNKSGTRLEKRASKMSCLRH